MGMSAATTRWLLPALPSFKTVALGVKTPRPTPCPTFYGACQMFAFCVDQVIEGCDVGGQLPHIRALTVFAWDLAPRPSGQSESDPTQTPEALSALPQSSRSLAMQQH
jgi:hypothetical protein